MPGPLNSPAAYGNFNSNATLAGVLADLIGLSNGANLNANLPNQNINLHDIASRIQPKYEADEWLVDFHVAYNLTEHLTVTTIFGFNRDQGSYADDYNRVVTGMPFTLSPSTAALANPAIYINPAISSFLIPFIVGTVQSAAPTLFPSGVVNDPQIGRSNVNATFDYGPFPRPRNIPTRIRLASSFEGRLNFSTGLFYSEYTSPVRQDDYAVDSNALTAYAMYNNYIHFTPFGFLNPGLSLYSTFG